MKNKEILNRVHDFLGKVVRDCPDQEMGLEASDLADDVWDVLHATEGLTFGQAVEECYDAIAVLLRTIDVLEGRQKLGKPEMKGEANV